MRDLLYWMQLLVEAVAGTVGVRLYEEPRYDVIATLPGGVEVRTYAPRLAAEVLVPAADAKIGADQAFRLLFDYIAGANRGESGDTKIAMTTPVEVAGPGRGNETTPRADPSSGAYPVRMRFFLPSRFTIVTAPVPTDSRVRLVALPAETLAVLRYSGAPDPAAAARRNAELLAALEGLTWQPAAAPASFFYDAPFTLPLLRRNEAVVSVVPR